MKDSLKQHITTIFSSLQIEDISFDVYECKADTLPSWSNRIEFLYEFLICFDYSPIADYKTIKHKLQQFLGKDIHCFDDSNNKIIYWFEGEIITKRTIKNEICDSIEVYGIEHLEPKVELLKNYTSLPNWLDDYLFNDLGAMYAPEHNRYEYNMDLNNEEIKVYLGTYFPRSYAESFCIFDNLFLNEQIISNIQRSKINILDIGCGTGGDLIGLLVVIDKYFDHNCTISISAIDGNAMSLQTLESIVKKFQKRTKKEIVLNTFHQEIIDEESLLSAIEMLDENKFDFILSFKMLCELLSKNIFRNTNAYFKIVQLLSPLLSPTGLLIILDVTTKDEKSGKFLPMIMNEGINAFMKLQNEYISLLPISCRLFEHQCTANCFFQQQFKVFHTGKKEDISKVAYRIIVRNGFDFLVMTTKNKFIIHRQRFENQEIKGACCSSTLNYNELKDAFNFNT